MKLNTQLFADDQVILSNAEDNLQRGIYLVYKITKHSARVWDENISIKKTMKFLGQGPITNSNSMANGIQRFNVTFTKALQ